MKAINEKRVSYLYEAVKLGTVRAAADKLNLAPSAVSRQISLLEKELACILIERNRKGVTPTEAGEIILQFYRESLSNEETHLSKLRALQGLSKGHIKLAVGEGFIGDLMSGPLLEFTREYSNLTFSISVGGSNEVLRMIELDEAHIGLLFHPENHPNIRSHAVKSQPIYAIVSPLHPLTKMSKPLLINDVMQYPLALPEKHFGVRQLLAMIEFQERIRFQPMLTTNSIAALKNFVLSDMGVTLLPEFVVSREINEQRLLAIPIQQEKLASGEVHIITRLGRQLSDGPHQLLQSLITWIKK